MISPRKHPHPNLKAGLYGDYKLGVINNNDYQEMKTLFEQKRTILADKVKRLEEQKKVIDNKTCLNTTAVTIFKQYKGIEKLNRTDIGNLVNEIVVDGERNITINFMFDDEVKKYVSFFEKKHD